MSKEMDKENPKQEGSKLKIAIIVLGIIAIFQLGILFVVFKDPIMSTISSMIPEKVEETLDYPLSSMQVNLADKDREVFLRTTLNLRYQGENNTEILNLNLPQIQAKVIEILRSKTLNEIKSTDKTKEFASYVVQELNELLGQDIIKDVLFIEFLYQ